MDAESSTFPEAGFVIFNKNDVSYIYDTPFINLANLISYYSTLSSFCQLIIDSVKKTSIVVQTLTVGTR